jgi:REP element-mobilizing transposase RayT
MPQSHAQIWLHIVFSTKDRRPYLRNESFRAEMCRMLAHHVQQLQCTSVSVNGHEDHVHLLAGLSRTVTVAKLVEKIKTETSRWAKEVENGSSIFAWQSGYGAFSVSHSMLQAVDKYIRNQAEHHAKMTFRDEYRKLCSKHGIEIDERYVW